MVLKNIDIYYGKTRWGINMPEYQEASIEVIVSTIYGDAYAYVYNLSVDGCERIPYEMQPYNNLVYYVAYGSNILEERFLNYIQGGICRYNGKKYSPCHNSHKPIKSIPYEIPYNIYFSKNSPSWNGSPVCFLDVSKKGFAYGKAYLITKEQLEEIQKQEGISWYGRMIELGTYEGFKCYTFTNSANLEHKNVELVSTIYLNVIKEGIRELYNLSDKEIDEYLLKNEID